MEMSTGHSKVKVGGGAMAAEEYQRREGRYKECGRDQVDAMSPVMAADAYQSRQGDFAERNDLLEAKASVPAGAPAEWAESPGDFWKAAELAEVERAYTRYAADQARCVAWREANAGVAMGGVIAEIPEEIAGDDRALVRWVDEQTKAFHRSALGKAMRDGPLVCKIRVETEGREQQPVALRWEAKSRAEWMASEGDLAFRFHVSIDNRFTEEEAKDLAARIREHLTEKHGLYCSTAIHWKEGNHHIHGIYNLRRIDEHGHFGEARITRTPKDWSRWNKDMRRFFAEIQNDMLREKGLPPDVEWRSFKDRGIDRAPTEHEGIRGRPATERKATATAARNNEKREALFLAALAEPEKLLREVERTKATWTRDDLARSISGIEGADEGEIKSIVERALAHADAVRLSAPGMKGETLYTTRQYAAVEARLLQTIDRMVQKPVVTIAPELVEDVLARPEFVRLSEEQRDAVRHSAEGGGLRFVVGVAGSGKTTLSKAFTVAAEEAGHRVVAMAPTGAAADTLGAELGVPGKTIASYIDLWDKLDDIDEMLATGRPSEKERARMEAALADKLQPLAPGVRRSYQRMLKTGKLSESRRDDLRTERGKLGAGDLRAGDIVLVDESGLAGTVVMDRLVSRLEAVGAAGRLTGDPAQYSAIDAGQPFRVCVEKYGAAEVTAIIRQQHDTLDCVMLSAQVDLTEAAQIAERMDPESLASMVEAWMPEAKKGKAWQQRASEHFSKGEGAAGLRMYMDAGRVVWTETKEEAVELTGRLTAAAAGRFGSDKVISTAGTNADVRAIHEHAQELVRERAGTIGPSLTVATLDREGKEIGDVDFHVGDRLGFLKNDNKGYLIPDCAEDGSVLPRDRQSRRGVRNGTSGTVRGFTSAGALIVELDRSAADPDGRRVVVTPERYRNISGGLSLTGQRAQGATASAAVPYMHQYTDARSAYVTCTRHRVEASIVADRETFATDEELLRAVDRGRAKTMVCDFAPVSAEDQPYRDMVAAFATADAKNRALFREIREKSDGKPAHQHPRWSEYEKGRDGLQPLAEKVADNLAKCAPYLRQAELSEGAIKIAAGRAEKVLSQGAEASRARIRVYAHSMNTARNTWNEVKETHPGARSRRHPDFAKFEVARDERDRQAAEVVKDPDFRRWTHEAGVSAATIEKHAAAHLERQAEADRVAGLTGAAAELHKVAESYRAASAELRAELEILRGMGMTGADVEGQTADRWAQQVRAAAAEMPDADAALEAEGLDPEAVHFAADRADSRDAWVRYSWHVSRGETDQADAVAEKILTRTQAERPAKQPKEKENEPIRDTAPKLDAVGALAGADTLDSVPVLQTRSLAPDGERAEMLLQSNESAELYADQHPAGDLRRDGPGRVGRPAPKPWTAAVVRGGGDWTSLQTAADRHAVRHAPPAVRKSVEAVQAWIEARDAAAKLAPLRMDKDEQGPPMPSSAEYEAAQHQADALAGTAHRLPAMAAAVEWWNARRRYPIDITRLEQAAQRSAARTEINVWQRARGVEAALGHAAAFSILDKARAEREAEGPRPMAAAIREAGGQWDQLDADARQHVLATSPEELMPARGAALAYVDAMRAARQVKPETAPPMPVGEGEDQDTPRPRAPADPAVKAAWQQTEAAAAALVAQPGWQDAVKFWDDYRAQRVPAAKATDTERLEKAAAQHQARSQVVAWQEAMVEGDVIAAGTLASEILVQTDAERAAEKGAPRPHIMAVASAEVDWKMLRQSAEAGAIAAAGDLAPTLRVAQEWLAARSHAIRTQSQAAEDGGSPFATAGDKPEVIDAWRDVDRATAALVRQPDWQAAVQWWDQRRAKGKEAKATDLDKLSRAAARHDARQDMIAWREATERGDVATAGAMAGRILAATDAERAAGKGAAHPYIAAVSGAGKPWAELKRSVEDAAVAATGTIAPTIRLAWTWLDARVQAVRTQSQAAEAAGLEFGAVSGTPEVGAAWERADALATFTSRPDAGPALDWLRGARKSVPALDQAKKAQSRHFGRALVAALARADTDPARRNLRLAAASLAAVDPVARVAMGRAGLDTREAQAMVPVAAISMARHAGAEIVRTAVAVVLNAADRQLSPQVTPAIVIDEEVLIFGDAPDLAGLEPAQAPDAAASAAWDAEVKEMGEVPDLPMLMREQVGDGFQQALAVIGNWKKAQADDAPLLAAKHAAAFVAGLQHQQTGAAYGVAAFDAGADVAAIRADAAKYVPVDAVADALASAREAAQEQVQESSRSLEAGM